MSAPAGFKKYFMRQTNIKLKPRLSMLNSNSRQKARFLPKRDTAKSDRGVRFNLRYHHAWKKMPE